MRRLFVLFALATAAPAVAQIERDVDLDYVRRAADAAVASLPEVEARWRERFQPRPEDKSFAELFGYDPPGRALQIAYLYAFLFERERRDDDAVAAAGLLARMADYRSDYPDAMRAARVEYESGLPAVPSFFQLADYAESWARVRSCQPIPPEARSTVESAIAGSADFVFVFPEWGAHNRAVLRAESLLHCALALPDHPDAARWRTMADILAGDSVDRWEIEDAQHYHPIWLLALFRYASAAGRDDVFTSVQTRFYLRYFTRLLTPAGNVPAFGDAWWNGSQARFFQVFTWGATKLGDPELRWAARRVYETLPPVDPARPELGRAALYARVIDLVDPDLDAREPRATSGRVVDDVIGKKVVLRDGYGDDDFYLCLNYRDEGDWGVLHRDYLRQTLAVVEEKMHHGQSDENSVILWMHEGSVLLHDAGYRDRAPSGPYGAYRADIFHNRLVARRGTPGADQELLEFLRDDGAYRPVRTEMIDDLRFELGDYTRTRVTDERRGYRWDRTLVRPAGQPIVVVIDTVAVTDPGTWTFAALWATQAVRSTGPGFAVGRTTSIRGATFPSRRDLLVLFPGTDEPPARSPLRRHSQDELVVSARIDPTPFAAGEHRTLVTVLVSMPPDDDPATWRDRVSIEALSPGSGDVSVSIELGGASWSLLYKGDLHRGLSDEDVRPRYRGDGGTVRAVDRQSDADLLLVWRDDASLRWGAANMTEVVIDGEVAFEARRQQFFQTTGRSDVAARAKWRKWEGARSSND